MDQVLPRLVAIVGPTATGKSALAVDLALALGGEVVNADSRLFYRRFDIGTAKPSLEERKGVTHHLIDFLDPHDSYSLARFIDDAGQLIREISGRGNLPVLAGGTGQYVWGLLEGWEVPRVAPDAVLRDQLQRQLESEGLESLVTRLRAMDPDQAGMVDLRNPRRVMRAIERLEGGRRGAGKDRGDGQPGTRKADAPPFDALIIGLTLPREDLYERVDRRTEAMVEAGWVDEVRRALQTGRDAGAMLDSPVMSSIGYRAIAAHLRCEVPLDEAVAQARKDTRRLVRRQYNWFKLSDPRIHWLQAGEGAAGRAVELVRERWGTIGKRKGSR